jgi:hypothetical protein
MGASTEILDVLKFAATQIGALHLRPGVRKRILLLTDGHDFNAFGASKQSEVCQLLREWNIVVDIILIGNASSDEDSCKFESKTLNFLFPLCYSSGGRMFHPLDEDESRRIHKLLGSKAFANLRLRMLSFAPRFLVWVRSLSYRNYSKSRTSLHGMFLSIFHSSSPMLEPRSMTGLL